MIETLCRTEQIFITFGKPHFERSYTLSQGPEHDIIFTLWLTPVTDGNDTAYLEYFEWRNVEPHEIEASSRMGSADQMYCDMCKEVKGTVSKYATWLLTLCKH